VIHALKGVRVLDLTRVLAGPFGAMTLADLGAEVVKIERPDGGDDTRATGPHFVQGESAYFLAVNRGKRSVCLDLSLPEGRATLHALAREADVVIENFRHGVAERLGCDAATLHAINPRLVVCGMTAFGRTGPDRDAPAFDLTLQARGGTMGLTGEPGRLPVRAGPPIGDLAGGLYAAIAICAALVERERTGKGSAIDLSLLDCQVALLTYAASFWLNAGVTLGPQGSAHAHAWPYQAFEAADGPLVVAVFTDTFWPPFCRALGREDWAKDATLARATDRRARAEELLRVIEPALLDEARDVWLARFKREGVPAEAIQSVAEVFADPQVLARAMAQPLEHPRAGSIRVAGSPLTAAEGGTSAAPPLLDADTTEVLRTWLGWDDARIDALRASGVVGRREPLQRRGR
jgi:formyl-CoA transferase/CoA:oxalate CoA-transferase